MFSTQRTDCPIGSVIASAERGRTLPIMLSPRGEVPPRPRSAMTCRRFATRSRREVAVARPGANRATAELAIRSDPTEAAEPLAREYGSSRARAYIFVIFAAAV